MIKRIISLFILLSLCLAMTVSNIATSEPKEFNEEELIEALGGVYDATDFLLKDNSVVEMRRILVDKIYALEQINNLIGDFIKQIQYQYFLSDLSLDNYKDYKDALFDYRLNTYGYPGGAPYEVMAFNYFLSLLNNYNNNKSYIEMNGMRDSVQYAFELVGNVKDNTNLIINNEPVNLYSYFEDSDDALNKIKILTSDCLEYMIHSFDLEELNSTNYREYQNYLRWIDTDSYPEFLFDIKLLRFFFDIYENEDKNDEIINYMENSIATASVESDSSEDLYLISLLPKDTALYSEYMDMLSNQPQTYSLYDKYVAYNYALTYATSPNVVDYEYMSGCDFILYFGIYDEFDSSEYYEFSYSVDMGDIIVLDSIDNEDYDWDHVGFVGSDPVYDPNEGTFDFYIIQHTRNYQNWASQTGWCDTGEYNGYAIVRP